jgi:sugar phosphate isomerase/epimerase
MITRREAIKSGLSLAAAGVLNARTYQPLRLGIMDIILGFGSSPEAFAVAQKIGFEGVQVMIGKPTGPDRLVLSDPARQQQILQASSEQHVAITSTYLDVMHRDCLQSAQIARTWVRESIRITKVLDAKMVELAFFFKCGLHTKQDETGLVDALRELAPEAERAGIILGIENTLSAEDNMHLLDRVGSPAVKIWYDVGNSTNMGHFDVPKEIRTLGKDRICQMHIKDKTDLGTGDVNVRGCIEAIHDIGYTGWCVFETAAPTGDRVADAARNLKIFQKVEQSLNN